MAGPTGLPLLGCEGWPDDDLDLVPYEAFATLIVMFIDTACSLPVLKGAGTLTRARVGCGPTRTGGSSLWPLIVRTHMLLTGGPRGPEDEVAACDLWRPADGRHPCWCRRGGAGAVTRLRAHGPQPRSPGPLPDGKTWACSSWIARLIAVSMVHVSAHSTCRRPDAWTGLPSGDLVLNCCPSQAARCVGWPLRSLPSHVPTCHSTPMVPTCRTTRLMTVWLFGPLQDPATRTGDNNKVPMLKPHGAWCQVLGQAIAVSCPSFFSMPVCENPLILTVIDASADCMPHSACALSALF